MLAFVNPLNSPNAPSKRVGIHFLEPFPTSADGSILVNVAIGNLNRYVKTYALSSDAAPFVTYFFLGSVILRQGAPRELVSDRAIYFLSRLLQNVLKLWNTIHRPMTAYRLQTNDLV